MHSVCVRPGHRCEFRYLLLYSMRQKLINHSHTLARTLSYRSTIISFFFRQSILLAEMIEIKMRISLLIQFPVECVQLYCFIALLTAQYTIFELRKSGNEKDSR